MIREEDIEEYLNKKYPQRIKKKKEPSIFDGLITIITTHEITKVL